MINIKNEHVFKKKGEWVVVNEGIKKISIPFEKENEAMEYASIIALIDGGQVITHK